MMTYYFLQLGALLLIAAACIYTIIILRIHTIVFKHLRRFSIRSWAILITILLASGVFFYASNPYPLDFAMPPMMHSMAPGGLPASIPFKNAFDFLLNMNTFERIADIGAHSDETSGLQKKENGITKIALTAQEVLAEISPGIYFNYWTYNQQVPGPFFRVRQGDTVEVSLTNHVSSLHEHTVDFHAATGPGGGAALTKVKPGETRIFQWKALNPGLYVYHCATPNVSTHNAHGQYGMILVEPKNGLPPVDREFYIMQGELYTQGGIGKKGLTLFDSYGLIDGNPSYVTFNGKLEQVPRLQAETGDKIRMYVGNGGVNLISSFHIIGEIFDMVYPEGAIGSAPLKNVQTTAVLPGGSSIVEFSLEVPGNYVLVDHALARMNKGAWAIMKVSGPERPDVFKPN